MLFENLAATDDSARVAARKAVAVANKRVSDFLGDFLKRASSNEEREARLALVEEDVARIVADVTDQYGGDPAHTLATIREVLGCDDDDDDDDDDFKPEDSESSKKKNKNPFADDDDDDDDDSKKSKVAGPLDDDAGPPVHEESGFPPNMLPDYEEQDSTGRPALTTTCAKCGQGFSTRDNRVGQMGDVECPHCGTEQTSGGQLLAPKSQWGEETGESLADIYNPRDPESLGWPYESSTRTARRPKMCPYHSELVDSSLQSGSPQYAAFSGLVGGPSHCKGGFDGSCNFKPDMVTQSYWDKKDEEYADRRRQREQERARPEPVNTIPEPGMPTADEGEGINDIDTELTEAPSAVGGGESEHFAEEPSMAMSASQHTAEAPRDGGGAVTTEELKPNSNGAGWRNPSPKIDKTTWKPNALNGEGNLDPIDTTRSGSPNPTETQDVTDKPTWKAQDDETWPPATTDSVTEHQELPGTDGDAQMTERNITQSPTDTFGGDSQADAITRSNPEAIVSAAQDPNKNPIREVLNSEWPTETEISQAIASFKDQG